MTESKKKYLLFKKDDGRPDAFKPCAFFMSPAGCKNGTNCNFSHTLQTLNTGANPSIPQAKLNQSSSNSAKPSNKRKNPLEADTSSDDDSSDDDSDHQPSYHHQPPAPRQPPAPASYQQPKPQQQAPVAMKQPAANNGHRTQQQPQSYYQPSPNAQQPAAYQVQPQPRHQPQPPQQPSYQQPPQQPQYQQPPQQQPQQQQYQVQQQQASTSYQALSTYQVASTPTASSQKKARKSYGANDEDDTAFLFNVVNHALQGNQMASPLPAASYHATAPVQHHQPSLMMTQQQLQSAPYVVQPPPVAAQVGPADANKPKKQKQKNTPATPQPLPQQQQPPSTSLTASWSSLVQQTINHPRYLKDYNFPNEDSSWIKPKASGEWSRNLPTVISVDCEMCETTDPVTQEKDHDSLCRISMIDGHNPSRVLLDVYLLPSLPISDMKTAIHGITEEGLRSGSVGMMASSLRHVQAMMLGLISEQTILIGHALHNDFKALRLRHSQVIDTSYLYTLDLASVNTGNGLPYPSPSLREISEHVLKNTLPTIHDAVQDAQTALSAAIYIMQHGSQPPILRSSSNNSNAVNNNTNTSNGMVNNGPHTLLVHRIPDDMDEATLQQLLVSQTYIVPHLTQKITGRSSTTLSASSAATAAGGSKACKGKCVVVFTTKEHASLAFDSIPGPVRPDNQNKPQKRIYLKGAGYIAVRKND